MKKHTKKYLSYFGYTQADFIPCEICGQLATDIHHIDARGMGGSDEKDCIENLMAMCRLHHIEYGDIKVFKEYLKKVHLNFIHQTQTPKATARGAIPHLKHTGKTLTWFRGSQKISLSMFGRSLMMPELYCKATTM